MTKDEIIREVDYLLQDAERDGMHSLLVAKLKTIRKFLINDIYKPQGLDEVAMKAGWEFACKNKLDPYTMGQAYSEGHKAGAKWMAEQGYVKEVQITPYHNELYFNFPIQENSIRKLNLKDGDQVIVQIRRKEK